MANLDFTPYKKTLMQVICTSTPIVNLMKLDSDSADITGRDMRYNRIYPYNYVPLTIETAQTFICFTVTAPNVKNNIIADLRLTFYVFTHQDLMRTENGMRTDLLVHEIDKLVNGSTKYGLGKVELKGCDVMQPPAQGYSGLYADQLLQCWGRRAWIWGLGRYERFHAA